MRPVGWSSGLKRRMSKLNFVPVGLAKSFSPKPAFLPHGFTQRPLRAEAIQLLRPRAVKRADSPAAGTARNLGIFNINVQRPDAALPQVAGNAARLNLRRLSCVFRHIATTLPYFISHSRRLRAKAGFPVARWPAIWYNIRCRLAERYRRGCGLAIRRQIGGALAASPGVLLFCHGT